MIDEIRLAFAHPEERARAMAPSDPPDRISLRDYIVSADIGAFQQERGQEQRLRFNVAVELAVADKDAGDDVDRILSYDRLTEAIATELSNERLNLLETLAERIAARILAEPQASRVFLRVEKIDRGPGALGVEIVRSRADASEIQDATTVPHPVFVYLDAATAASEILQAVLDGLAEGKFPVVLTLGPAASEVVAATPEAQRRIDLLSVEQAAWRLAARDPRITVVATRTELDWAIKQGNMVVWAPSKIALDTTGAPQETGDGLALALWLAEDLDARHMVVHGSVAIPAGCRVPVVRG